MVKAISGRLIEITVGTLLQGTLFSILGFPMAYELGFITTIIEEILCFFISFLNERAWNRVDWGREVEEIEGSQ